jgi:hypothetical protein
MLLHQKLIRVISDFKKRNKSDVGDGVVMSAIESTDISRFLPKRLKLLLKSTSWATFKLKLSEN